MIYESGQLVASACVSADSDPNSGFTQASTHVTTEGVCVSVCVCECLETFHKCAIESILANPLIKRALLFIVVVDCEKVNR